MGPSKAVVRRNNIHCKVFGKLIPIARKFKTLLFGGES